MLLFSRVIRVRLEQVSKDSKSVLSLDYNLQNVNLVTLSFKIDLSIYVSHNQFI